MMFSQYECGGFRHETLESIIALQTDTMDLFAHAENSGSEGCYVEIARWSYTRQRWERFAFCKLFNEEIEGLSAVDAAKKIAAQINGVYPEESAIVHRMPSWQADKS